MVNVKAEYPEGHKVIYENPKPIHKEQELIPELKEKQDTIELEEEPIVSCPNKEVEIIALKSGVVAKIPVVLAALTVRVNISSSIELSEPVFQIKEIMKKVNIDQCTLIQDTNIIFIKGNISKDISFYTASSSKNDELYGEVQNFTVEVPFKCTTPVNYNIMKPEEVIKSTIKEFKYFINSENKRNDSENEESNLINQVVTEYYNESPYCEIVGSTIVETERLIESKSNQIDLEQRHRTHAIEGEGIINITIRVLQKRLVSISSI